MKLQLPVSQFIFSMISHRPCPKTNQTFIATEKEPEKKKERVDGDATADQEMVVDVSRENASVKLTKFVRRMLLRA